MRGVAEGSSAVKSPEPGVLEGLFYRQALGGILCKKSKTSPGLLGPATSSKPLKMSFVKGEDICIMILILSLAGCQSCD